MHAVDARLSSPYTYQCAVRILIGDASYNIIYREIPLNPTFYQGS